MDCLMREYLEKGVYAQLVENVRAIQGLCSDLQPYYTGRPLVRIGGPDDGGYLVPYDFEGIKYCFSAGVGAVADFEADLLRKFKIVSFLADASVDFPPQTLSQSSFIKKYVSSRTGGDLITLEDWVNLSMQNIHDDDMILQMDIEGSEYEAILSCPRQLLAKFRHIVIEMHNIEAWSVMPFFNIVSSFFSKILSTHVVAHIHPNNNRPIISISGVKIPECFEVTFTRRDRVIKSAPRFDFPHVLDRSNNPALPELQLPPIFSHSGVKA